MGTTTRGTLTEETRKCFICHREKEIDNFRINGRGRRFACEDCYDEGKVNDHHRKTMNRKGKTDWMRRNRKYYAELQYK